MKTTILQSLTSFGQWLSMRMALPSVLLISILLGLSCESCHYHKHQAEQLPTKQEINATALESWEGFRSARLGYTLYDTTFTINPTFNDIYSIYNTGRQVLTGTSCSPIPFDTTMLPVAVRHVTVKANVTDTAHSVTCSDSKQEIKAQSANYSTSVIIVAFIVLLFLGVIPVLLVVICVPLLLRRRI